MVQFFVNNQEENYGFMIKLQTEEYYRRLIFASSDNQYEELWPRLTVVYK